jgi:transcriptional regulator with XRE-family HTH domain
VPAKSVTAREIFAANIRRVRKAMKLSQEDLAEAAGLHRTYVGAIERAERNVSLDNIEKLAAALGLPIDQLLVEVQSSDRRTQ